MLLYDIDFLKEKLYYAIEHEDSSIVYNLSVELDMLIVEYYKNLGRYIQ